LARQLGRFPSEKEVGSRDKEDGAWCYHAGITFAADRIMNTRAIFLSVFLCMAPVLGMAQDQPSDGVHVGEKSIWRNFAPTGELEQQAAQQYTQIKQQAAEQKALAPDNYPQLMRLRTIAKRLIPYAMPWNDRARQWQWEVNLIGSKEVNAYCMPGGKIAFYTGILDSLKLTDDEVAIVMGHEMAHALREHGAKRAGEANLANLAVRGLEILASAKGYDPNLAGTAGGAIAQVGMLRFSRADETEADVVGLDIASRAGFDPRAGIALWEKMALINQQSPPQWLSTHPSGDNRIGEIRRHLPEVMPLYSKTRGLTPEQLPSYKSNVKGLAPIN
jgi:predicted Zn-dependent protease